MVKSDADVIKEFNELVNMTASELEKWLKSDDSTSSGWTNGNSGGETVGHNSGTKIVDILKRNPDKKKDKYTEDDLKHMRKVVSYNKRHLAQEQHLKEKKSKEELQKTKSYKSLKNGQSDSSASTSFRSDVALPTALNLGKIGTSATSASTAAASSLSSTNPRLNSAEYLDSLEEGVNKSIDTEIGTLLSSYKELISLATIADKDKFRVAQEAFQTEARADIMVRSAQTLSLLSEALKLSLLLSKTPDPALNDEALQLIESTEAEKLRCAMLLGEIMGLDVGKAKDLVEDMDRSYVDSRTTGDSKKDENGGEADKTATATAEGDGEGVKGEGEAQNDGMEAAAEEELEDDEMEDVPSG
ncbi:uncharacterized protein UTRI_03537_B [Ustilago trichophora]|uniref:Uncharacterized protein n=1 Tax=Ustilago trichophora TaxID=86804 RepID=A0A5C3E3E0_9BASI|nr:uncharacterized protein UTRI_03537_B [Ustilago trichophora]